MTKILVRRSGALGDVILSTPIIRRLRQENPDAEITVQTGYLNVFIGNPRANAVRAHVSDSKFDRVINLDLAYEKRPMMHVVDAYMMEAFGDTDGEKQQELFFDDAPLPTDGSRYIAVHATQAGWKNRTLPRATWAKVVVLLREAGLWPVLVGGPRDDVPGVEVTRFLVDNIAAQAAFINRVGCFVGSDSGLLHVVGATNTPIVGVFTCALPALRLPIRGGILGKNCTAVQPNLKCVGCLCRRPAPVTTEFCERSDNACVSLVRAENIVEAVVAQIKQGT